MGVRQFSLLAVIAATILACGKCQMGLNDTLCQLLGPQAPGGLDAPAGVFIGSLPTVNAMYAADPVPGDNVQLFIKICCMISKKKKIDESNKRKEEES